MATKNKVELHNFPMCCGMYILANFYKNNDPSLKDKPCAGCSQLCFERGCKEENLAGLYETQEEYLKRIKDTVGKYVKEYLNYKSYILATLNEEEEKEIGYIFRDAGFVELIPMTKNPTGTAIITYIFHLLKPKETKSVIAKRSA